MECERERPHLTTTNSSSSTSTGTSELFICFTSRLSSSSMKLSSKSLLSPGRARDSATSQISLSSSLSRRLKTSGSLKGSGAGQASPMFPTGGKKRGSAAFENPEPSSPKVTCIGQVRVKTKKQGNKIRNRSKKRSGGEASFRRAEQSLQEGSNHNNGSQSGFQLQQQQGDALPHRNQKWVHLPLTICEALRAFGAEFNCFLPCRSSCMSSSKEEKVDARSENNSNNVNGSSSCGAAFARWLVAVQDGDHGKGRDIELVVGDEEERVIEKSYSQRRQVFEGIEFKEEPHKEEAGEEEEVEEEKGRVSICIPPKNALLLMRCRSDPVKMAALANRFWESPAPKENKEDEGEEEEEEEKHEEVKCEEVLQEGEVTVEVIDSELVINGDEEEECEKFVSCDDINEDHENPEEKKPDLVTVLQEDEDEVAVQAEETLERRAESDVLPGETEKEPELEKECEEEKEREILDVNIQPENLAEEETGFNGSLPEMLVDPETKVGIEENVVNLLDEPNLEEEDQELEEEENNVEEENEEEKEKEREKTSVPISSSSSSSSEAKKVTEGSTEEEEEEEEESTETETQTESEPENPKAQEEKAGPGLPDCLLLMMCEPKLSMEVSKETWVCSTDFIRWLPERRSNPKKGPVPGGPGVPKKRPSMAVNGPNIQRPAHHPPPQQPLQPPRSSCSFPLTAAPQSMASMIEQKLVGSKPYEPFVLTRCKSEPMRSAAKLAPDACFWKNRKLEPHRPATLGVGAAGVGF